MLEVTVFIKKIIKIIFISLNNQFPLLLSLGQKHRYFFLLGSTILMYRTSEIAANMTLRTFLIMLYYYYDSKIK